MQAKAEGDLPNVGGTFDGVPELIILPSGWTPCACARAAVTPSRRHTVGGRGADSAAANMARQQTLFMTRRSGHEEPASTNSRCSWRCRR